MTQPALARRSGVHAVGSVALTGLLCQLMLLVSGPVVARMLGPEGRGTLGLVILVTTIIGLLVTGGLPAAVAKATAEGSLPGRDAIRPIARMLIVLAVLGGCLATVTTAILTRNLADTAWLAVGAGVICATLVADLAISAMLQGEGNTWAVNIHRLVAVGIYVAMAAILFIFWPVDRPMVLVAVYICGGLTAVILAAVLLRRPTRAEAQTDRTGLLSFARKSWLAGSYVLDSFGIDQLLVALILGATALGHYVVASSIVNLALLVVGGLGQFLLPRMVAQSPESAILTMRRWLAGSVALAVLLTCALELVIGPAIRIFFGAEFIPSIIIARILAVAWALLAVRRVLAAAAQAQGQAGAASMIEVISVLGLLVGFLASVPSHGATAAAWCLVSASAANCIGTALVLRWRPHAREPIMARALARLRRNRSGMPTGTVR